MISRYKTAMHRRDLSAPVKHLITSGWLPRGMHETILDYGCGHGKDVWLLQHLGYRVYGWDPHYTPDIQPRLCDHVLCTYVLNVIEDLDERRRTVLSAFYHGKRSCTFTVRRNVRTKYSVSQYDGIVTGTGTFQKAYTPDELVAFVESVLSTSVIYVHTTSSYVLVRL